jgi:hypothetical protein
MSFSSGLPFSDLAICSYPGLPATVQNADTLEAGIQQNLSGANAGFIVGAGAISHNFTITRQVTKRWQRKSGLKLPYFDVN